VNHRHVQKASGEKVDRSVIHYNYRITLRGISRCP
jgi:hypothetical protein